MNSSGLLSGVPTTSATDTFVVRATDGVGLTADQTFTLAIHPQFRLPLGAISWWRAEGAANDSLGSNHGTMMNGATFGAGIASQGFQLDGTNDYVSIPDAPSLRPSSLTIEGWFRFDQSNGIRLLVAKPVGNGTADSYALWLQNGELWGVVGRLSGNGFGIHFPFSPTPGRWYHLAYTFDGVTKQEVLYVDTALAALGFETIVPEYDTRPLVLGCDIDNGSPAWFHSGAIDELALYNRVLGAGELAAIHNARSAGKRLFFPLETWKLANLGNPDASLTGDSDFDGVAALIEYAFGMSPTLSDAGLLPQVSTFDYPEGRRMRIVFPRDPGRNDITIEVQVSGDPGSPGWSTIASSVNGAPTTGAGYVGGDGAGPGLKQVEVRDIVNMDDVTPVRRFLRLRVSQ